MAQVFQRQFTHLAGAEDQDRLVVKVIEDLADIRHGRTGYADVAAGDAGFGADTLGGALGMLKDRVQHWPGGAPR